MWLEKPPADWQSIQNQLRAHFLQSSEWGELQSALGHKTFFGCGDGWSWLAVAEKGKFGNRLYCPYGPTVLSSEYLSAALHALIACAKAHDSTYIRIEPQGQITEDDLLVCRLKPAHRNIQPRYTFIKDLTKSENDLLAEMSATNRNLYRTAGKKGITFRTSSDPRDITIFLDMAHEVAHRNNITFHPDNHYQTMARILMPLGACKLYIADVHNVPAASSLVLESSSTRYYAHAASYDALNKLHPNNPLLSHMIFDAKTQGQVAFDFYGITPTDQVNNAWAGFTKFKQSFGGRIVDMHGTWELAVKRLPYVIYRLGTRLL